jgi:hypothetical protein
MTAVESRQLTDDRPSIRKRLPITAYPINLKKLSNQHIITLPKGWQLTDLQIENRPPIPASPTNSKKLAH